MPADMPNNHKDSFQNLAIYAFTGTSSTGFYLTNTLQSGLYSYSEMFSNLNDWNNTPIDNNKKFIKLDQSFSTQIQQTPEIFNGQNIYSLKEKMKLSTDPLLSCVPDKISLELTHEGSIFYTLIKNDIKIYFQHFLIDEFDDSDEAIVSVFKGDNNLLNYGGSLHQSINQLAIVLSQNSIMLHQFA